MFDILIGREQIFKMADRQDSIWLVGRASSFDERSSDWSRAKLVAQQKFKWKRREIQIFANIFSIFDLSDLKFFGLLDLLGLKWGRKCSEQLLEQCWVHFVQNFLVKLGRKSSALSSLHLSSAESSQLQFCKNKFVRIFVKVGILRFCSTKLSYGVVRGCP